MQPSLLSLFAGVGGFDLGFHLAGFRSGGMCEIDRHARKVLDARWPDVPKHDDVATLEPMAFGPADVVTFGSPCQDLSVAGKRAGMAGDRSGLFFEAIRVIRGMREATHGASPRFAVWENVPGAFTSNGGRDFAAVLGHLLEAEVPTPASGRWAPAGLVRGGGRSVAWRLVDSQRFGVPQRRRRIFLVADFGGDRAGHVLFESEGVRGDPAEGEPEGQGVAGTLEACTRAGGFPGTDGAIAGHVVPVRVSGTVSAKWAKGTGGPAGDEAQNLVPVAMSPTQQGMAAGGVAPPIGASDGGGNQGIVAFTSKDGGQDAGEVAPTLRAMTHRESHANGGGQVAVAFSLRGRDEGNVPEVHGDGSTTGTLRGASGGSTRDLAAVPIQDGRAMAKGQNGLGVGAEGDPAYTLDSTGAQAVGAPIGFNWQNWTNDGLAPVIDGVGPLDRSQVKAVAFRKVRRASSPEDAESWAEAERANTLNGFDASNARTTHAVVEPAYPLDLTSAGSEQGTGVGTKGSGIGRDGDPAYTVRSAAAARPAVGTEYAVRRLTPRECERLQGFPDDWTRWDADGGEIANTHRYRMMGNAVTVNVAAWLAARLRAVAYPD